MIRGSLAISGFEGFIGFGFLLYAGHIVNTFRNVFFLDMPSGFEALVWVLFFVGVASFAGIPVIIKKTAKGIKLFIIISVIQIGTIISCLIYKTPDQEPMAMFLGLSIASLAILINSYWKRRRWS